MALELINDVGKNFDKYWKDNLKESEPSKDKYVRNAKATPLGGLLDSVNKMVLMPHDRLLPNFIFGGIKGKNHVIAAEHLLGKKRKRVALKMDIQGFFEKISWERVYYFFRMKCECKERGAKILADICCVPLGSKGSKASVKTIGRGFATSSRLAVWCNLDTFIKLERLVQKRLKGRDPRIMIYVDDIGITASRISKEEMKLLGEEVEDLLLNSDKNQPLPLNNSKTKITSHEEGIEQLGLRLNRNSLSLGKKSWTKQEALKKELKTNISSKNRANLKHRYKSMRYYKSYIERSKNL
jgi:hypothetical protein